MSTYGVGWVVGFGLLLGSSGAVASAPPYLLPPGDGQSASAAKRASKPSADPLARRITMPALQAPLGMVLREIARQGGVALSYSPTRLPLDVPVRVPAVREQSVAEVLAIVLQDQPIRYGVLADQIVLWRRDERPPAAGLVERSPGRARAGGHGAATVSATSSSPGSLPRTRSTRAATSGAGPAVAVAGRPRSAKASAPAASPAVDGKTSPTVAAAATHTPAPASEASVVTVETRPEGAAESAKPTATAAADSSTASSSRRTYPIAKAAATALTENAAAAARKVGALASRTAQKMGNGVGLLSSRIVGLAAPTLDSLARRAPAPMAVKPQQAAFGWQQRGVQVSLIPPLSTNGLANGRTVNKISLNLVLGYAAGVRGVEIGGGMNYVRDSVIGLQLGGVANGAGGRVLGAQIAGVINIATGGLEGVQSAGLINISRGASAGWQSAGLLNIAHSRAALGLEKPDLAAEPLVQFAGFLNSAPRGLHGAQVAGFLNVAGRVKGVQIAGFLNIADTVAGVSLAPLNFVRRGYHALEVSTEGNWPLALTLKLGGSAGFYTYFTAVSAGGLSSPSRWGLGYGVGSELAARQRLSFSIDGQAVQFKENGQTMGMWEGLNMHAQIRPQVGWGFGRKRRVRLVAGPVLNVLVTEHLDPLTGSLDSSLSATGIGVFSDAGKANTRTSGWISASAGLRWRF